MKRRAVSLRQLSFLFTLYLQFYYVSVVFSPWTAFLLLQGLPSLIDGRSDGPDFITLIGL